MLVENLSWHKCVDCHPSVYSPYHLSHDMGQLYYQIVEVVYESNHHLLKIKIHVNINIINIAMVCDISGSMDVSSQKLQGPQIIYLAPTYGNLILHNL